MCGVEKNQVAGVGFELALSRLCEGIRGMVVLGYHRDAFLYMSSLYRFRVG